MEECLTKSNTSPWVFFTFIKLYKWYQIVQKFTNKHMLEIVDPENLSHLR